MALDKRDLEIIDKCLIGSLTVDDQSYFDLRMNDKEFSKYYQQELSIVAVIRDKGRAVIKNDLQKLEQDFVSQKSKTLSIISHRGWLIAASLILLVSVYTLLRLSQDDHIKLYQVYYSPYPNLIDPITKGDHDPKPNAYQLYEMDQWVEAEYRLKLLESTIHTEWYLAQTILAGGDTQRAFQLLKQIPPDTEYYYAAQWYKALVLLKINEIEKSVDMLKTITEINHHPYGEKAVKLLSEL